MYATAYNEIIQCLRARIPAVNVVLESERIIDKMLPGGLLAYGTSPINDLNGDHGPTEKGNPVIMFDMNVVSGINLAPRSDECLSTEILKEASTFLAKAKQKAVWQVIQLLPDIVSRLKDANLNNVHVLLVVRDVDTKTDQKLHRMLLQHCSLEVPATVAVVTCDPIESPDLRACIPVISVTHPSVLEITRTVKTRLDAMQKLTDTTKIQLVESSGCRLVDTAEASEACGKALAGLHVHLALNLLVIHLESGMRSTERPSDALRLSLVDLSNDKANILNKAGYMSLIKDLPDESRIGGLERLKTWVKARVAGFSKEARENRLSTPKGIMLVGPPGTAKSLSAKVIAKIFGVPLIRLDIGALFNSLLGSSERNIRNALSVADASSPCVLWLDEI